MNKCTYNNHLNFYNNEFYFNSYKNITFLFCLEKHTKKEQQINYIDNFKNFLIFFNYTIEIDILHKKNFIFVDFNDLINNNQQKIYNENFLLINIDLLIDDIVSFDYKKDRIYDGIIFKMNSNETQLVIEGNTNKFITRDNYPKNEIKYLNSVSVEKRYFNKEVFLSIFIILTNFPIIFLYIDLRLVFVKSLIKLILNYFVFKFEFIFDYSFTFFSI